MKIRSATFFHEPRSGQLRQTAEAAAHTENDAEYEEDKVEGETSAIRGLKMWFRNEKPLIFLFLRR